MTNVTGPVNSISRLLLRDEMDVEVRGQLVVRGHTLVVTGYRMLTPAPGTVPALRWELTPYVRLDLDPDQELAYEELLGETVYGRGVYHAGSVQIDSLVADDSWARRDDIEDLPYRKDLTAVSDEIRSVEAALFAHDIVLRRVRLIDEAGLHVIAVATDVAAARSALEPVYGDALEILPSPLEAWQIHALDDVLNDLPEDKVLKVEYRMDGAGRISRKLRVNYVDAELVRVLGRFPDAMLAVEAVVEPLGTPQDRDLWFPPAPRRGSAGHHGSNDEAGRSL